MNLSELLEKSKQDEVALNDLLKDYKPLVMSIARKYYLIGGELDDLIQEGMIGLYRAVLTYKNDKNANFTTFASICVNRQIQTAIKKANSGKNKPFTNLYSVDSKILDRMLSNDCSPEDIVLRKESLKEISDLVNINLSKLEKEILKNYLMGKSYEEIGNDLHINKKSVDNGLNRIIKKLEKTKFNN